MFSRIFSRIAGRGCGSCGSTSPRRRRRPAQRLAAAAGQAIDALESRVMLSTIYVDASAPGLTYDGASWTTAYKDLQLALSASTSGDEIRIADGTYKPTSTTDRTISFALRDGVAIRGGYAGYGAAEPDARAIALYPTVLSGDIGAAGYDGDNSYHVLTASGVGSLTLLDGVNVTGGRANSSGSNGYGAGLYATGSSPMLINCTFSGNSAGAGGGIYNSSSSPTLTDCTFSGNSAGAQGGGMMCTSSSSPKLINCTFSNNSANYGGGMYNSSSSSPTLTNCTFSSNRVSVFYGGGMYNNFGSSPKLTNCTFNSNSAKTSGGGIYNSSSSPTLTNCTFSSDSAGFFGGGMANESSSSPNLINCTFSGNSARDGGGMYNSQSSSSPSLINCTFIANSASSGGGMHNTSSSAPTLTNCTFSSNSANSNGGGISNFSSSPNLVNCILWGNSAPSNPQVYQLGSASTITFSDIEGGHTGTGNIDADPLFVCNPSPGADGLWNGVNDDYGDLRLQPGSPCIDHGNNAAVGLSGTATDLAGKPRLRDIAFAPDTGVGSAPIVDLGAYEVQLWCPLWLDPAGSATWDASAQTLDIGESALVVAADDSNRTERLAAIRQFIASARDGGAGIVSSAAGEDQGVIATLDEAGNILVRLALVGDVTLDDQLDGDDYFALDTAFLAAGGGFQPAADLNVDGVIDGRDHLLLDLRFLRSMTAAIQQSPALPVAQVAQHPPAGLFSAQSIADELLLEDDSVLMAVR